jgi:hypothetical protein
MTVLEVPKKIVGPGRGRAGRVAMTPGDTNSLRLKDYDLIGIGSPVFGGYPNGVGDRHHAESPIGLAWNMQLNCSLRASNVHYAVTAKPG